MFALLQPARSEPHLVTLILLTAISTLSLNMFLPSLVNIADDMRADYSIVSLSIAGYLGVTAALQIVIGPLSDRIGRRPVMLSAIAVFTAASVGCLLAQDIWVFLTFRMLQGAIIAGAALSPAVVRDTMPAQKAASILGYISMAMAVAPMLGPIIGGALDGFFGWRSNFLAFVVLGAALFILTWSDMGETNKTPTKGFGPQFRAYPALLTSKRFWGYALCMSFSTGGFYIFLAGAPLVSRALFGTSAGELGFYIGSITAGFFLGSFVAGRLAEHRSLASMMVIGRVVACVGLAAGVGLFLAGYVHELSLFGTTIFVGVGNGITMPSSSAGVMSVDPRLAGSAAGLAGAVMVGAGAILTMISSVVVTVETGALALLGLMLGTALLGLAAALWIAWLGPSDDQDA